jgi:hypothetical protein
VVPEFYAVAPRILRWLLDFRGPGSSVGIATGYGLDGPVIESRWAARFSAPVQTGSGAHPASCTMGSGPFPGVKSGQGVTLTPHSLLVLLVMKEYSYTSTPRMGRTACTEPQCLYKGDLYLLLPSRFSENLFNPDLASHAMIKVVL